MECLRRRRLRAERYSVARSIKEAVNADERGGMDGEYVRKMYFNLGVRYRGCHGISGMPSSNTSGGILSVQPTVAKVVGSDGCRQYNISLHSGIYHPVVQPQSSV